MKAVRILVSFASRRTGILAQPRQLLQGRGFISSYSPTTAPAPKRRRSLHGLLTEPFAIGDQLVLRLELA